MMNDIIEKGVMLFFMEGVWFSLDAGEDDIELALILIFSSGGTI